MIFFVAIDEASPASSASASTALEKSTFSLLLRAIAVSFCRRSTDAEEDGGQEKACERGPFESKSVLADIGILSVAAEVVSTLDIGGSHQSCREGLEDECNGGEQATEICSQSCAERQETCKQSACTEEEGDQREREHEPRHVEVVFCANEVFRDALCCAKIFAGGRIERTSW